MRVAHAADGPRIELEPNLSAMLSWTVRNSISVNNPPAAQDIVLDNLRFTN